MYQKHQMKIAVYTGKGELNSDARLSALLDELVSGGCEVRFLAHGSLPEPDVDMIMSVGGDGTFLSVSTMAAKVGIPVVGVNLGRLGFLSENPPETVAGALLQGRYAIEKRTMLEMESDAATSPEIDGWPYALNEMTVHRSGAAILCVDVSVDGVALPTYWADGLVVSTPSGSTAYSLSVGGPIVMPDSRVLIVSPISPHNLNVRPIVVPDSAEISIRTSSRDGKCVFTADNRTAEIMPGQQLTISLAQFSLNRVRLDRSDFMSALTEKLYWGEDIRNLK